MLRATLPLQVRGQFQDRLKTRLCGYIPKVVPRKIKGALVMMHAESNTGHGVGYVKSERERIEQTGKKLQKVAIDPILGRYVVMKESRIKHPSNLKSHIQKKINSPLY